MSSSLSGVAQPPSLLYTEWAVLIACVHVYLPFMVMPLATAIWRASSRRPKKAARIAGLRRPWCFLRVTLPLSLPGLAVGVCRSSSR